MFRGASNNKILHSKMQDISFLNMTLGNNNGNSTEQLWLQFSSLWCTRSAANVRAWLPKEHPCEHASVVEVRSVPEPDWAPSGHSANSGRVAVYAICFLKVLSAVYFIFFPSPKEDALLRGEREIFSWRLLPGIDKICYWNWLWLQSCLKSKGCFL